MKACNIIITIFLSAILVITSCVTSNRLTYLQYKGTSADTTVSVTPTSYQIQPFDNLYIRVITPDPKWSDMFNPMPATSSGSSLTEQSANLISYSVDADGSIELPYVGRFEVVGKTLETVKTELQNALKGYVTDPAVIVKMVNNYVSVIGEVKNPGRYPIYKDKMNIFQALALAGDLGEYSDRRKIQVVRPSPTGNLIKEFSLTDRSILNSDFFYVMPNDVLYAKPMKGKFFQMNAFPYTVLLSSVTTFILILSFVKK